jgi:MFS family permease
LPYDRSYSLVLLTNVVIATHLPGDPLDPAAINQAPGPTCQRLTNGGYLAAVVVNAAELPGLLAAMWALDRLGRRATIAWACGGCAAACGVMLLLGGGPSMVLPLFVARACALAFNQSLWILACEVCVCACVCVSVWVCVRAVLGGARGPWVPGWSARAG